MRILFEESFLKDLERVKNRKILKRVATIIREAKEATKLDEIRNLKKLQGYVTFYRIRVGEYRIGLEFMEDKLIFVRFLHRKDIYRYFP